MVGAGQRVAIEENVTFASADGRELKCDVYRPPGPAVPRPAILFVYGGGWHSGNRAMMRGYALLMARQGYLCVCSDYRLTGEARWPAQIDDVRAAISWLRAKSSELGIDPAKIVLWGQSAGGQLALLAAAQLNSGAAAAASKPIAACVTYYPVALLEPGLGGAWKDASTLLANPTEADWRAMSPLMHVTSALPPTLILHGSSDETVVVSQTFRLYDALTKAGVPTDLHIFAGQGHGFDLDRAFARHSVDVISMFLSRYVPAPPQQEAPS